MNTEQIAFKSAGAVAVIQEREKQPVLTSVQGARLVKVDERQGLTDNRKAA
jgi:hypothetical protein